MHFVSQVAIHRYGELRAGARSLGLAWPFPDTNAECFEAFARIWNMTGARYGGTAPSLGEGDTRTLSGVRTRYHGLLPTCYRLFKVITLPRQARDKHGENSSKRTLSDLRDENLAMCSNGAKTPSLLRPLYI